MIRVKGAIGRSRARSVGRIEVEPLRVAHLRVRSLERSVDFYRRVFGLNAVGAEGEDAGLSRSIALPDGARLVLHERCSPAVELLPMAEGFGVVVRDLDWAREAIWDLGLPVASDSGEPDHIYRWPNGRSLYVRDPDGHEIEVAEIVATAAKAGAGDYGNAAPQARGEIKRAQEQGLDGRACRRSFRAL